ncbi:MAG: hypothetical protein K6T83_22395 [Alicyclobacillus sp.]|nr:hypothetical protein [Alicyclobacillus sp.]
MQTSAPLLSWTSAALLTVGSMLLAAALAKVLTIGGRRPDDDLLSTPAS